MDPGIDQVIRWIAAPLAAALAPAFQDLKIAPRNTACLGGFRDLSVVSLEHALDIASLKLFEQLGARDGRRQAALEQRLEIARLHRRRGYRTARAKLTLT